MRWGRAHIASLLLGVLSVWTAASFLHTETDLIDRGDCPACQLERSASSDGPQPVIAKLIAEPARSAQPVLLVDQSSAPQERPAGTTAPRGPPA